MKYIHKKCANIQKIPQTTKQPACKSPKNYRANDKPNNLQEKTTN